MSFTEDKQLKGLADAAGKILDESLSIYELVTKLSKDESNEFMGAAAAAKKAGPFRRCPSETEIRQKYGHT